jgi:tetratricopeptide (TPR) repeat protein
MITTARLTTLALLSLALLSTRAVCADSVTYSTHADQLMKQGEYEKALDELKSGYSLYPYDLALRKNLAFAYAQVAQRDLNTSHYGEAAQFFAEARELSPETRGFGFMRGVALYLDKQYDTARAEFEQAGDSPDSLIYLGKISYDTGDLADAVSYWRRASDKNPGNTAIKSLIEKAERELPVESKMDKGYSSMFDLSFDAELPPGLSAEVLDALESAYNSVGADLGLFPTARIPVLLYTKSDYRSVTAGPDWSGGLYDGKIRLPVGGISTLTPQLRGVIFHEYTHVLIAQLTHGNIPTWLNEGLAEIEGRKQFSHPGIELAKAARGGKLLSAATLTGPFTSMSGGEAAVAYEQSHSMANYMVSHYGWYKIQAILKGLGEGAKMEAAVASALSDWSLDLPAVYREWRDSLNR